jgi:hypothetical protein
MKCPVLRVDGVKRSVTEGGEADEAGYAIRGGAGHEITGSEEVQRILRLYREKYPGFNGGRFHQIVAREHGVTLSYTFVKKALQVAGLVPPTTVSLSVRPGLYPFHGLTKVTKAEE